MYMFMSQKTNLQKFLLCLISISEQCKQLNPNQIILVYYILIVITAHLECMIL